MYSTLLYSHSLVRWLVFLSLIFTVFKAYKGYVTHAAFSKTDNLMRHWTATFAHFQLLIGLILYFQSPVIKYIWSDTKSGFRNFEMTFWGIIHIFLMQTAIIIITIGSALAKRQKTDIQKFRTVFRWFLIALIIIFVAIPWPFSPLASRPFFR